MQISMQYIGIENKLNAIALKVMTKKLVLMIVKAMLITMAVIVVMGIHDNEGRGDNAKKSVWNTFLDSSRCRFVQKIIKIRCAVF